MTLVISYRTPVRSTPRHTIASGAVLVASTAIFLPRRGPPYVRARRMRSAATPGRERQISFVDAEERADRFDHGHVAQCGDGVLDGGLAGDVGGEHDLGAG